MEPSRDRSSILRFGLFEIDVRERELRRSGLRQKLGPQPFQVLEAMLERPGELISRDELRKRLWPENTFVDHDLALKKCVNRIREVLGDSAESPRFVETVPRIGYRFIAPVENVKAMAAGEASSGLDTSVGSIPADRGQERRPKIEVSWARLKELPVSIGVMALLAALAGFLLTHRKEQSPAHADVSSQSVILPLTSIEGQHLLPAVSPDGSRVAFLRLAAKREESGIYAAVIHSDSLLRLSREGGDYSPAWSPDAREIAFLRDRGEQFQVQTVPALGGGERTIYVGERGPLSYETGPGGLTFSPNGQVLAFSEWNGATRRACVKLLSRRDGTTRYLTTPPPGFHDRRPSFSPRGDQIAFVRSSGPTAIEELWIVSEGGGEAKELTFDGKEIFGPPAWTKDGDEILFSSNRAGLPAIWRISVSGGPPRRVPGVGAIASYPSLSLTGKELGYEYAEQEENSWRLQLNDATHVRGAASVLVSSAKSQNLLPRFSPDGSKIAFQSERSGYSEIWICNADGSQTWQATSLRGFAGGPQWSPDSRYLVFDYRPRQHSEIYTLDIGANHARSVAAFPDADTSVPSWSRDGRWIYFSSNRGGKGYQIWKVAVKDGMAAGDAVQVTRHGGFAALESADGRSLFYSQSGGQSVREVAREGGDEVTIWPGPGPDYWSNWAVANGGIYFLEPQNDLPPQIVFLDLATRRVTRIATLEKPSFYGLTVSPDGQSLVYSQWDRNEHRILVMDQFR